MLFYITWKPSNYGNLSESITKYFGNHNNINFFSSKAKLKIFNRLGQNKSNG